MAVNYEAGILLLKDESTPGTAETLAGSDGGLAVSDITFNANPKPVERNILTPDQGQIAALMSPAWEPTIEFTTELKTGAAVDVPPKAGEILKMCGFSETINAGTSVVYELGGPEDHKTMAWDLKDDTGADGPRFLLYGAQASMDLSFGLDKAGEMVVRALGKYQDPVDVSPLSIVLERKAPRFFIGGAFTINGVPLDAREFSVSTNREVFLVPRLSDPQGWALVRATKPRPTFTVMFAWPDLGTHDIFTLLRNATEMPLVAATPTVVGETLTINASRVQYTGNPQITNDRGIPLVTMTGQINIGGANHFTITQT